MKDLTPHILVIEADVEQPQRRKLKPETQHVAHQRRDRTTCIADTGALTGEANG